MDDKNERFWSKYSNVFEWSEKLGKRALDILVNYKSRRKLKFPDKLEDNFMKFYFIEKFPVIRFSMRIGLLSYLLFGVLDYLIYPEVYPILCYEEELFEKWMKKLEHAKCKPPLLYKLRIKSINKKAKYYK
jgi:hypothetical protein